MIINDCVTGSCIHCTTLFIFILECTLSTYKKMFAVKERAVSCQQQSRTSVCRVLRLHHFFVLDTVSCSFVQLHAVQVGSLGAIGYPI